jgi:hypothetical protein
MNRSIFCFMLLSLSFVSVQVSGQIVQLPTFRFFSVGTTVVIPDRGSAYLGGVNRATYGSSTTGVPGMSGLPGVGRLFTNRGIGSEVSSSGVHASATIMDLEELDKSVLAEAAARRGVAAGGAVTNPAVERKAAFLAKHMAKTQRTQIPAPPPRSSRQQK